MAHTSLPVPAKTGIHANPLIHDSRSRRLCIHIVDGRDNVVSAVVLSHARECDSQTLPPFE
jgi:hypothetical protein